jgi:TonB family protein
MESHLCFNILAVLTLAPLTLGAAGGDRERAKTDGDRAVRIIRTTDIRPNFGLHSDVPSVGEVELVIVVDAEGKLQDMLLLGSTHRIFTEAAVQGLQEWRYEPALDGGKPVAMRTVVRIRFEANGRIISVSGGEVLPALTGYRLTAEYDQRLVEAAQLDRPLQAVEARNPGFPLGMAGQFPVGEGVKVTVDFYVDEAGRPRMPVVLESGYPLLSAAALDAIEQWRFEPPLHDGKPVVVRARQDFVFRDSSPQTSEES